MIGYSPGTLYNIFQNLDDVLLTLQIQLLSEIVDNLKSVQMGQDGERNIKALTSAYVDFAMANRRLWNLLFAHNLPPPIALPAAFYDHTKAISDMVSIALEPLAAGVPADKLDTMSRAYWAGIHGITAIAATEKGMFLTPATAQTYSNEITTAFVKALRCP